MAIPCFWFMVSACLAASAGGGAFWRLVEPFELGLPGYGRIGFPGFRAIWFRHSGPPFGWLANRLLLAGWPIAALANLPPGRNCRWRFPCL